ncbi:succinate dehydrogenase cytochrome b subunit [Pseudobacteriovorax antillogorgiicola]|uniref:Succinate dehydrogenase subunit C n=1 Tax=Pseudobacteriovorax antillogorgiicola TaxID=1513793 RepID=A0A1Y6B8E3_9BACT|nr:succinate dehydrogenase cytochrome b subunit [Pseudobacteriovorax antillogorgiicola]TCS59183.1 succinate dehydrogenase subunit C [Pseudobacteriovorax antillogorgiicola]SME90832.1 succinate dehydrogenase subunit C [Pseudobacteriovorax antillogorgiicola]
MSWMLHFFRSSLGSKYLMAITGLGVYGFFIVHILGNLTLFAGQDAMNNYAIALREIPFGGLWIARLGLVAMFAIHIVTAIRLTAANKSARPQGYAKGNTIQASFASRFMPQTGMIILAFVIFHLAHFTWRVVAYDGPYVDSMGRDDVYTMVVAGFQQPLLSVFYMAAVILVGIHLSHGSKSMFQSLGLNHPKYRTFINLVPPSIGWLVALAGVSIPLAVLLGIVK